MKRSVLPAAILALFAFVAAPLFAKSLKIGVFIPGVLEGSPTYLELAAGAEKAAAENPGSSVRVYEAGFNQAEWEEKLANFVATGSFDIVITSNPSMPDLIEKLAPLFPNQKFIALDGYKTGIPNLHTVLYNQVEQGYLAGYLAGLVSSSQLKGATKDRKVGMIIGQRYPAMDRMIVPGFEQGLKAADPQASLDLRVLGNWYDATKAAELAKSMLDTGVDVILPICGSASQGVIRSVTDAGRYLIFFDSDEYARAPSNIVGCIGLGQRELAYSSLKAAAAGSLAWGSARVVGVKEGYVSLLDTSSSYLSLLPFQIRSSMSNLVDRLRKGTLVLPVPAL